MQYERGLVVADQVPPTFHDENLSNGHDITREPFSPSPPPPPPASDLTRVLQLQSVLNGPTREDPRRVGRLPSPTQGGTFDLIVDIQCYHVLRGVDLERFVLVIKQNLKCGGLYLVMTGNDKEADVGPTVLSKSEVTSPFSSFCDVEAIFETRFDATPHYDTLAQPPLAWCALFRRRVELDASAWTGVADCWAALLSALGAPDNHLHSVDALVDSMLGDHNTVCRPVTIRVKLPQSSGGNAGDADRRGGAAAAVRGWAMRLRDVLDQLSCDGAFADGRRVRFLVE